MFTTNFNLYKFISKNFLNYVYFSILYCKNKILLTSEGQMAYFELSNPHLPIFNNELHDLQNKLLSWETFDI